MKKILLILLIAVSLVGCTKTVYVDSTGNEVTPVETSDFVNFKKLSGKDSHYRYVAVDIQSDILYMMNYSYYGYRIPTPIMKADGTCLTYTEWKERNK